MHVFHLCDTSVEGDYFKNITAGLTENGVRVSLAELSPGSPPAWLGEFPGVSYFSLGARGKLDYPFAARRLARLLKQENVDILQTHLFYSGLVGVFAKRFYRKTIFALMRHHTGVVRMLGSRFHVAADKWMAQKADHVMTVSEAAKDYMRDVDGIARKIDVVYLGFDFDKLSPNAGERERVRREFGFAQDDLVIGYVGNFAPGKGHLQLVEAFAAIVAEMPNAKLFFVGRGMLPEIECAAAELSPGTAQFAGWRVDVAGCLNAMDLFVQPSLSEAFSQVLIEAMGVGLPVIATDVGGASEVIEDGINGILIAADDRDAIANETVKLCQDGALRRSLASAGMSSVGDHFTADKMVERHLELYKSWLDK